MFKLNSTRWAAYSQSRDLGCFKPLDSPDLDPLQFPLFALHAREPTERFLNTLIGLDNGHLYPGIEGLCLRCCRCVACVAVLSVTLVRTIGDAIIDWELMTGGMSDVTLQCKDGTALESHIAGSCGCGLLVVAEDARGACKQLGPGAVAPQISRSGRHKATRSTHGTRNDGTIR